MKSKTILTLVLALVFQSAYSQIKFEESFDNDLVIIGNISSGAALNTMAALSGSVSNAAEHKVYCRIFKEKVTYGILVSTSNRFDDDFEFALGQDIEAAKESINAILDFMANSDKGKSITVTDEDNRRIQINYQNKRGIVLEVLDSDGEIVCDNVVLTIKNLQKAITLLDTKAEAKVAKAIEKNKMK